MLPGSVGQREGFGGGNSRAAQLAEPRLEATTRKDTMLQREEGKRSSNTIPPLEYLQWAL